MGRTSDPMDQMCEMDTWATSLGLTQALGKICKFVTRAGLGPNPTRNLTCGSRVFKNPNRTGSLFGDPSIFGKYLDPNRPEEKILFTRIEPGQK